MVKIELDNRNYDVCGRWSRVVVWFFITLELDFLLPSISEMHDDHCVLGWLTVADEDEEIRRKSNEFKVTI